MDPPGNFPLIVRGGGGINPTYDGATLAVRFRKASVAAGEPATYGRLPLGSAAWVDRPVNADEPSEVRQQMSRDQAVAANNVLEVQQGWWKFVCHNTNAGHFEAVRSERAFGPGQIIDDNP